RAQGFVLLPKRWIVERTFAWLGRCRRLNRDVEATLQASQAWLIVAHIRRLLRKITQTAF
ncbi:transposase, partial [Gluconobacter kondonii]